jgi:hypothetical protein
MNESAWNRPSGHMDALRYTTAMKLAVLLVPVLILLGSCAASSEPPPLTPADELACVPLGQVLDDFNSGVPASVAFERHAAGPWPGGQPSPGVRAAYNAFRQWVAAEDNENSGVGSYGESVSALAAALAAKEAACG